jgi:asparagine synthase (glutamine-hydrolysing)
VGAWRTQLLMCGIAVIVGREDSEAIHGMLERMRHRGPDDRGVYCRPDGSLGQVRLSIIDLDTGHQPLVDPAPGQAIVYNGEVYNFRSLRERLQPAFPFLTRTDTEVILRLYQQKGTECLEELDGMFAFAIYDNGELFLARDRLGIKPLYYGRDSQDCLVFASELKALDACHDIREFPPGHSFHSRSGFRPYYTVPRRQPLPQSTDDACSLLREVIQEAVVKRLVADVPVGVFLSGGLDSSIIAALMRREIPELHSFAVGMEGAPDLAAAREVAEHLGTHHHDYLYTADEMLQILSSVIYYLESFDMPLVRSAIPGYLVSRLAARHVKVILTGEGSDELFSGYHHLKTIENPEELSRELHRITSRLHNTNLQRTDRMSMAHSIEARVPFLDSAVIDAAASLPIEFLQPSDGKMEKWLLRTAFEGSLPPAIVWRRKQKFSEGAGSMDILTQTAEQQISDDEFAAETAAAPVVIRSKEELLYFRLFCEHYGTPSSPGLIGQTLRY